VEVAGVKQADDFGRFGRSSSGRDDVKRLPRMRGRDEVEGRGRSDLVPRPHRGTRRGRGRGVDRGRLGTRWGRGRGMRSRRGLAQQVAELVDVTHAAARQ
jgi:hypothetical protein